MRPPSSLCCVNLQPLTRCLTWKQGQCGCRMSSSYDAITLGAGRPSRSTTGVLMKRGNLTREHARGEHHALAKAETWATSLQGTGCPRRSAKHGKRGTVLPLQPSEGTNPVAVPISGFQPPQRRDTPFLLWGTPPDGCSFVTASLAHR